MGNKIFFSTVLLAALTFGVSVFGMNNFDNFKLTKAEEEHKNILVSALNKGLDNTRNSKNKFIKNFRKNEYKLVNDLMKNKNINLYIEKLAKKFGYEALLFQSTYCYTTILHTLISRIHWGKDNDLKAIKYILSFPEVAKRLLNHPSICPNIPNNIMGNEPLVECLSAGNLDLMKLLVENGAHVCISYMRKEIDCVAALHGKESTELMTQTLNAFEKWYKNHLALINMGKGNFKSLNKKSFNDVIFI